MSIRIYARYVIRICYRMQDLLKSCPNIIYYTIAITNHEQYKKNQQQQNQDHEPIVIQLYPLAIRDNDDIMDDARQKLLLKQ